MKLAVPMEANFLIFLMDNTPAMMAIHVFLFENKFDYFLEFKWLKTSSKS